MNNSNKDAYNVTKYVSVLFIRILKKHDHDHQTSMISLSMTTKSAYLNISEGVILENPALTS